MKLSRRQFFAGLSGGLLIGGITSFVAAKQVGYLPPTYGSLLGIGEALTFASHRVLLRNQPLAPEFNRDMITKNFPAINTVNPKDDTYQQQLLGKFADWKLPVTGLIDRPTQFTLKELQAFPSRTQVTRQVCEQGWSAIAQWSGVQLSRVLSFVGMQSNARYVVFHCVDGWWDSVDMLDALHPQTILSYAMNGASLPVAHGAPLRLRVERQLGYKNLKYIKSVMITDRLDNVEDGTGSGAAGVGYSWYAGI